MYQALVCCWHLICFISASCLIAILYNIMQLHIYLCSACICSHHVFSLTCARQIRTCMYTLDAQINRELLLYLYWLNSKMFIIYTISSSIPYRNSSDEMNIYTSWSTAAMPMWRSSPKVHTIDMSIGPMWACSGCNKVCTPHPAPVVCRRHLWFMYIIMNMDLRHTWYQTIKAQFILDHAKLYSTPMQLYILYYNSSWLHPWQWKFPKII